MAPTSVISNKDGCVLLLVPALALVEEGLFERGMELLGFIFDCANAIGLLLRY
jgi:hypothetical protein